MEIVAVFNEDNGGGYYKLISTDGWINAFGEYIWKWQSYPAVELYAIPLTFQGRKSLTAAKHITDKLNCSIYVEFFEDDLKCPHELIYMRKTKL